MTPFSTLNLKSELLEALEALDFTTMTPIQSESLGAILEGRDVLAQAKTGSGKTVAFGLGVLQRLSPERTQTQALILTPTRELADQVAKSLRSLSRFIPNLKILTLCGGAPVKPQRLSLTQHTPQIVVGTPGRVEQHLREGSLTCNALELFVLDEADRMLDMGFLEDMQTIRAHLAPKHQTLLFCATYDENALKLSTEFQHDALHVRLSETPNAIEEHFFDAQDRFTCITALLAHYRPQSAILFCNTKIAVHDLCAQLREAGHDALALHGDLEQYERTDVLVQFANRSAVLLVATDLAARGLDIPSVDLVLNVEIPHDEATYTHRIGRTARAGRSGVALSLDPNHPEAKPCPEAKNTPLRAPNVTIVIEAGKKQKLRKGDILGALAQEAKLEAAQVGQIDIYEHQSYVAVARDALHVRRKAILELRFKGRKFPLWILDQ